MANRSKIMGLHGLKNHVHRNGFDLSHRNLFTAKVGELLPCFVQELNPNDSISIDTSWFTRTAPLQSAAFTRLKENVQFFFVPYSQLWKYFETQVLNMTKTAAGGDVSRIAESPFENAAVTTQMPFIPYKSLHQYVGNLASALKGRSGAQTEDASPWLFNNGEYRYAATSKLLQMLGYGNFAEQSMPLSKVPDDGFASEFGLAYWNTTPNLSILRLLAYQKICNDHYTFRQWQPYDASLCNVDYLKPSSSALDLGSRFTDLQFATSDDKNSRLNMLDMRFSNLPLDYLNGVLPTAQFGDESSVSLGSSAGATVDYSMVLGDLSSSGRQRVPMLAFPTVSVVSSSKPTDGDSIVAPDFSAASYTNWESPISVPSATGDSARINQIYGNGTLLRDSDFSPQTVVSSISNLDSTGLSLRISALRNALAMQKYKEIQLANDVDFVSQIEAHFGIKPHASDTVSKFLGGNSSIIDINPIVNNNLDGDSVANVKAAPTGNGDAKIKFTADNYGVVIGIYRCTPVLDYSHIGIDRQLLKTDASDFVIPELDSIGMQQNYLFELFSPSIASQVNLSGDSDFGVSYGYAPRYSEYKTSYDRVNGDFCFTLDSWVTGLTEKTIHDIIASLRSGNIQDISQIAPELFNCRPDLVNNIFVNQNNLLTSDDKLYVGCANQCFATRALSVYGLPYCN